MKWDINIINKSLKDLETNFLNEEDDFKKSLILLDFISLEEKYYLLKKEKYRSVISKKKKEYHSTIGELLNIQQNTEDYNDYLLSKNYSYAFRSALFTSEYSFKCKKPLFTPKIDETSYVELVDNFFQHFDNNIYEIFNNLKNGHINFANKKLYENRKGSCSFSLTNDNVFINVDYFYKDFETLPHEITHAYEFSLLDSYLEKLNWHASTFDELLPNFTELAFANFCENNGYNQLAIRIYSMFFEELQTYSIVFLDNLHKSSKAKKAKIFLNFCMALYLFNIYKYDLNTFNDFYNCYNLLKTNNTNTDDLIWKLFNEKEVIYSLKEEIENINVHIKKLKK